MTGMAAIAFCAAFTSCSKGEDLYNEEQINQNTVEKIKANYAEAFVATFGQPAANQDWGFGSLPSGTRNHGPEGCINVNGNMWDVAPAVDVKSNPTEVECIYNYVKDGIEQMQRDNKRYSTKHPENLYGYFVTHVRNGKNADNNYTLTYKRDADHPNGTPINGVGANMDLLKIAMSEGLTMDDLSNDNQNWQHINNFNGSSSNDHSNVSSVDNGNTKVEKKGAYDFAYWNSLDNKFHNKWILVDGADIESTGKYSNYYYVCFDFESTPQCVSKFRFKYNGTECTAQVNGAYTAQEAVDQNLAVTTWVNGVETTVKMGEDIDTSFKSGQFGVYNGLQVESVDNGDKMLPGDNKYTDWIIRITKGEPEYDIRVIAEDLLATAEDDDVSSDWDFNDVVFDVKFLDPEEIGADGKNVKIRVVAAGGTYPLYVAGQEVHALLGYDTDVMINTNASHGKHADGVPAKVFYIKDDNAKTTNGKSIKVTVDFGNGPIEIEAVQGKPAAKIGVSPSFVYCSEKQSIKRAYTRFTDWVQKKDPVQWWSASQTMR